MSDTTMAQALLAATQSRIARAAGTPAELALRAQARVLDAHVQSRKPRVSKPTPPPAVKPVDTARSREYLARPCRIGNQSLDWAVIGGLADGSGGGVLAWCWDEADAQEGMVVLAATNRFVDLHVAQMVF